MLKIFTNLELSKAPAIIPATKDSQLNCPISLVTETKVFVIGEFS